MKNYIKLPILIRLSTQIFLGLVLLSGWQCEEKPLEIPNLGVGNRRVLIEEVTGVRCPNCPDGTRTLVGLQKNLGADRVILVSIHAAQTFSVPYPENIYDFRFPKAQQMADYVGTLEGFPTAAINRVLSPLNPTTIFVDAALWNGLIADELSKNYGLGVFLNNTYKPDSRELTINVNITPEADQIGENRLTVLITQDSIVDTQLDGAVKKLNYVHRHVLRDIISSPTGDVLEPLTANVLTNKTFQYTLPPSFVPEHCSVVAFVHRNNGDADKIILQAAEEHVIK